MASKDEQEQTLLEETQAAPGGSNSVAGDLTGAEVAETRREMASMRQRTIDKLDGEPKRSVYISVDSRLAQRHRDSKGTQHPAKFTINGVQLLVPVGELASVAESLAELVEYCTRGEVAAAHKEKLMSENPAQLGELSR